MSNLNAPPIQDNFVESTNRPTKSWILFFTSLFDGDTGTTFVPIPTNLGVSGTPIYAGAYYRSGQFIDFYIYINPGSGNTTSTAGTTYFQLPFDVKQDGACFAVGALAGAIGMVTSSDNRCYPPNWSAAAYPITIHGRVLAS